MEKKELDEEVKKAFDKLLGLVVTKESIFETLKHLWDMQKYEGVFIEIKPREHVESRISKSSHGDGLPSDGSEG
ncbi:MAG: hypothetical protein GWN86_19710 [Desulfobacterales bacterium]|nr:hypothetical protein [Desulfobacterales bacterium]